MIVLSTRAIEAMIFFMSNSVPQKPNFAGMSAEANKLADAFRDVVDTVDDLRFEAYRLAYAFYSGVGWEELTDRERKAFLIWQETICDG